MLHLAFAIALGIILASIALPLIGAILTAIIGPMQDRALRRQQRRAAREQARLEYLRQYPPMRRKQLPHAFLWFCGNVITLAFPCT